MKSFGPCACSNPEHPCETAGWPRGNCNVDSAPAAIHVAFSARLTREGHVAAVGGEAAPAPRRQATRAGLRLCGQLRSQLARMYERRLKGYGAIGQVVSAFRKEG